MKDLIKLILTLFGVGRRALLYKCDATNSSLHRLLSLSIVFEADFQCRRQRAVTIPKFPPRLLNKATNVYNGIIMQGI